MNKNLITLFLFLLFAVEISAQDFHAKIKTAVENKDYQTAINELQRLEKSDKKTFYLYSYDYLLARMAEKNGDFALALAGYTNYASNNKDFKYRIAYLDEYALWHLSQFVGASGNLMLERIYLQKILMSAPDSLLNEAADKRIIRSFIESGNFNEAIRLLNNQTAYPTQIKDAIRNMKLKPADREDSVLLGELYLKVGKTQEGRKIFADLVSNLPNPAQPDDFALAGAKNLDLLDVGSENFGKIAPQLTDNEHYRRALIYQFNRNFPLARLHFQAIVERFPNSTYIANSLYQIGRSFAQEGNYSKAIDWFERVQAEFPNDDIARDALSQTASAYSRVNKPKEAISRYQKFIQTYPNADNLERAYLNIVDILRDQGENGEALKWTARTQTDFKGKLPEAIALFAQTRIHISQNDWTNALSDLNILLTLPDLGGTKVPGGTNKAEITFLKGLTLENLNRFPEAIDVYLSIPDGRNEYYGWRATERLKLLANYEKTNVIVRQKFEPLREITKQNINANNAETIKQAAQSAIRLLSDAENTNEIPSANMTKKEILTSVLRQTYAVLPNYKIQNFKLLEFGRKEKLNSIYDNLNSNNHRIRADVLLFLGLYDEGTPELDLYLQQMQTKISDDLAFTLATFYKRGDWANKAVSFAEPVWRKVPADYQIELIPREQLELLYPTPYADSLLQFAPSKNVDPRFVLAIMRQESRFRPDVKSYAAARGLMQFISTTANQIAQELNRKNFKQDELYNPPTAILFGSQYLSNLFKEFPNQPPAAAAGYNGGEDNMTRWLARSKSTDADRYIPEIVYSQSKDYVYRVMTNYRIYQMFYDENLKAK
ncbi:hypothetical protein BH20ACI1_BH20ACI1_25590 [soil metagenome]